MPTLKRPGTYVSEFSTPNQTVQAGGTSLCAFVGGHQQGPITATLINNWTEFALVYGGFPPTGTTATDLPYAVYQHFSNGGGPCYVVRVLGTGAVTASATLVDRSAVSTLTVSALNAGAWGNNIRIDIVNRGTAGGGRFDLIVKYGGTTDAYIVERHTDLSMVDTDARYVESIVNSPTVGSAYITVTDLDSATSAPNDTPTEVTGAALSSGANGAAPSTGQKQAALTETTSPLDVIRDMLTIAIPGEASAAVYSTAGTYAAARGNHVVLVDIPVTSTAAQAVTFAQSLSAISQFICYYPWVTAADPGSNTPGATRLQPPSGFVTGKIAETDRNRGVFKAPAGETVRLTNVVAMERKLTDTELDTLNAAGVNVIRTIPGVGTVVFGARTQSPSTADRYVNARRTLNYIKTTAVASTNFAAFENNDEQLWSVITSVLDRFLTSLWRLRGLRGSTAPEAFYVKCDGELNTQQVIDAGEVHIEIGVALQKPAEFVVIRIGQWDGGQSATEI